MGNPMDTRLKHLSTILLTGAMIFAAPQNGMAQPYLYWTDATGLQRYDLDARTEPEVLMHNVDFIAGADRQITQVMDLLIDEAQVIGQHTLTLDTKPWPPGMYLVRFQAGDETMSKPLIMLAPGG